MKKEKFYIVLIVLLLAINVLQLGAKFVFPKPPRNVMAMNLKNEIPKILNLDERQHKEFLVLVTDHRDRINPLQKQQRDLTLRYINNPSTELLDEIADFHKQKIMLTEDHFNDVFNILTESQKVNFPKFKYAVFQLINR